MSEPTRSIRMLRPLYGGEVVSEDGSTSLPFVLPNEFVEVSTEGQLLRIVEPAPERTTPQCPHFGRCGGCQYQMMEPTAQLTVKRDILRGLLREADMQDIPANIPTRSGEPYGYRNRIRLRVERVDGTLRFGYNVRTTTRFLPITDCPIAAPVLWQTAEAILAAATTHKETAAWLDAADEVVLFADDTLTKLQLTLACPPRTKLPQGSFATMMQAITAAAPQIVGAAAIAVDPRTGPTGRTLDAFGAPGLNYRVGDETYWISRGGFFQVNRFLLPKLVELVTAGRSGELAWDLFAGVGLFSRVLAKHFAQITAVEASPIAAKDLTAALKKLGPQHRASEATTLDFLHRAVLERDRPELVVLDPPRAGAGEEVCELLAKLAPETIVYVSCDPTTLARDWRVLAGSGYRATSTDLIDLFPQTFHMETIVVFHRDS